MLKTPANFHPAHFGEAALAASRQVWLASLGATVVTRDWVQTEAGDMFKTLVKEGTVVESRAIRFVGDQIETSVTRANSVWKRTRRTVEASVKQAADAAVDFAQQVLPRKLPMFEAPAPAKVARPAKKAKPAVRTPVRAKRKTKAATKRA
jgi:hypothetical protein